MLSHSTQIVLLAVAMLVVIGLVGANMVIGLKLMGDVEKFGRLLRKVRRLQKGEAVTPETLSGQIDAAS